MATTVSNAGLALQTLPRTAYNTFQSFIDSPMRLYSAEERLSKTLVLDRGYVESNLIPAIRDAAFAHAKTRLMAIQKRSDPFDFTVEALFDSHYRKQRNFGPTRSDVKKEIQKLVKNSQPIQLVGLMFTRKNICPLKRSYGDESESDLAEIIALAHLNAFAWLVSEVHPYGAHLTALSEGRRFMRAFDITEDRVRQYQFGLQQRIQELGLRNIDLQDYETFLDGKLTDAQKKLRHRSYEAALREYQGSIATVLQPDAMEETLANAIANDPICDPYNERNSFVPLWDSIRHSIPYPEIMIAARARGIPYESLYRDISRNITHVRSDADDERLRVYMIERSWFAAIEHNARYKGDEDIRLDVSALMETPAFRTTIRPKPGSRHLGIHYVRETSHRVHPWHGMAYLKLDGAGRFLPTTLTKFELEHAGAIPVAVGSLSEKAFFYADAKAAQLLAGAVNPQFNMSTRV